MATKKITCTTCPIGCEMVVEGDDHQITNIKGNTCKRGETFAQNEFFAPKRILATLVKVEGGQRPLVSVRSNQPLLKEKVFDYMDQIRKLTVKAPVHSGDVLIENIGNEETDIVATSSVDTK